MGVVLHVVRHAVVDDVGEVVDVEPAGGHVGGHEQLRAVLPELLHREVALLLREVAVERVGVVAIAYEVVGHLLRLHARAAEDDGVYLGVVVDEALEGVVAVLGAYHIIDVVDVLGALVARAYLYLALVREVAAGYALYLAAHGGGEEQRAVLGGQGLEDGLDVVLKTHGEHLVGLVEHDVFYAVKMCGPAPHKVDEAARGGHDDVHAVAEGAYLRPDVGAAVYREYLDAVEVGGEALHVVGYLEAELARRREDEGARRRAVTADEVQQGQAVGGRLARAGLRQGHKVLLVVTVDEERNHFLLYRHRVHIALLVDGLQEGLSETQFVECLHSLQLVTAGKGTAFFVAAGGKEAKAFSLFIIKCH